MDPQEWLQERKDAKAAMERAEADVERAETDVEKAKTDVKVAKEALEKWKQENPGFSLEDKWFLYHQKEVDRCYNALDKCYNALDKCYNALESDQRIYKKLIEMHSTKGATLAKLTEVYNILIRTFDYIKAEHSSSNSERSSGTGRNSTKQNMFGNKLISRDGKCLISGSDDFMACHIIPHSFASGEVGIWAQYYNPFCFDQNEGEYDVRNGILLSPSWYNLFRKYHFTIVYENEIYKIKTGILSVDVENGKVLTFPTGKDSNGNEWKDQWPAPEFFKWHNDKFDQRQIKLKANIDRLWFKIQRADGATHFDENDYRIKWLNDLPSTTDYEDPEISIKAPEDSLEFMEQLQPL